MSTNLESVRAWLLLRLRELNNDIETGLSELQSDGHHLADLDELASDVSVDGAVFEQFRNSSDTRTQIEKALQRLEDGHYEQCEECGEGIGEERLAALPFATQCVACKRQTEQAPGPTPSSP